MTAHNLFYVEGNAFVPTGTVSSTARRGCKWFRDAEVGDIINLKVTETKKSFGAAIVVLKELTTFRDAIENADHNHTAFNPKYLSIPGSDPRASLFEELSAAYGPCRNEEEFTILHLIRISDCVGFNVNPLTEAYNAIDSEHAYQLDKLGPEGHERSVDEWAGYIRDYAEEATHQATRGYEEDAVDTIRKVAAMGVMCLAKHGAPHREGF